MNYFIYNTINNKKSHDTILQIKENYSLVDPFREAYSSLRRYPWWKKSPIKQAPLDYFLISQDLLSSVNKCSIVGSYRSDHSMIILDISLVQFQKRKPLWKHNNSLLNDRLLRNNTLVNVYVALSVFTRIAGTQKSEYVRNFNFRWC